MGTFGVYLPDYPVLPSEPEKSPPKVLAPQRALNNTARESRERRAQIVAENAVLPVIYGRSETGGKVFAVGYEGTTKIVLGVAWCMGPSTEIERVLVNNSVVVSGNTANTGFEFHHHLGSALQVPDTWLSAVVSGYADNLIYDIGGETVPVTYSVFKVTNTATQGFPRFSATIKGRQVYDPRAINAQNLTEHMANVALSERVAPTTDTYQWAALYNDTRVYVNGIYSFTTQSHTQGTLPLTAGDLVFSDKPLTLTAAARSAMLLPRNASATDFCYRATRFYPQNNAFYCNEDGTTIQVCVATGQRAGSWDFTNPATTFAADRGFGTLPNFPQYNASFTSTITVRIRATQPVCWFKYGTGGDYEVVNPMGYEVLARHDGNIVGDGVFTYASGYAYNMASLITSFPINDGQGGECESGLPRQMLGDRYLIPHDIADYTIVAIEPQQVEVYAAGTYVTTHAITTASTTNPTIIRDGSPTGAGPVAHLGPVYFKSTGPFYLRTNDPVTRGEYTVHGWKAHYETEPLIGYVSAGYRYSDNPVLTTSDFFVSSVFGPARNVDWDSVASAANWAYSYITGTTEPNRRMGLTIDRIAKTYDWVETLRTYAGQFLHTYGSTTFFIPNAKQDVTNAVSITAADILENSLAVSKRGVLDVPTVMRIRYTDTTIDPWSDLDATAYASGVQTGERPLHESVVRLPGIQHYSQAFREAVTRLNTLRLSDVEINFRAFEQALQWRIGQVFKLTHPIGFSSKLFRIMDVYQTNPGEVNIAAAEYDPCQYCSSVRDGPAIADTNLPTPTDVRPPTGLTVVEEKFQSETGVWYSRIRARWNETDYLFGHNYEVVFESENTSIEQKTTAQNTATMLVQVQHVLKSITVKVRTVSRVLPLQSAWVSASVIPLGKYDVPVWPIGAELTGYEVGGEVRLFWTAADDLAINWYEIRYGVIGGTYTDAATLDRVDALRFVSRDVPEGTWRFYVEVIDSINQRSGNPLVIDLTVTTDRDAFLLRKEFVTPALTKMLEYRLARNDKKRRFVSDDGKPMDEIFTANPIGTNYPDIMHTYHSAFDSSWFSEVWTLSFAANGSFVADTNARSLWGVIGEELHVSSDGITYTTAVPPSYNGAGQYVRYKATASTTATLYCEVSGMRAYVAAATSSERGTVTTSATPGVAATVTLDYAYLAVESVMVTPINTATPVVAVVDNINLTTGTFDVYAFDLNGDQVAVSVTWEFKGV